MKKLIVPVFIIVFLSISSLAIAGKETGFYIGGSLGSSSLDFAKSSVNFEDDDIGYKIFTGYNFGLVPFLDLAVEGSYVDFGEASTAVISDLDVGITAWDAFGLICFNAGPLGIFGKVGQVWWKSDSNILADTLDKSSNDMAYGIGLRFQIGSAAVRAEYEIFDTDIADVDYFSVGVSWTF
jgi:outer membrane immunogenic protein